MKPCEPCGIVRPYSRTKMVVLFKTTRLSENIKPRNVQQHKLKLDSIPNNTPHVNNLRDKPLEGAKKPICFQQQILSNSLEPVNLNLFSCGDRNQIYKMMDLRHVLACVLRPVKSCNVC